METNEEFVKSCGERHKSIEELLQEISSKLDMLNECTVRNGGGRHITYQRQEFNQMLYDKGKLNAMADKVVKYSAIAIIFIQSVMLTKELFFK